MRRTPLIFLPSRQRTWAGGSPARSWPRRSRCARREGVQHAHGGSPGGQSPLRLRPARHFHVVRRRRSERCVQRPVRSEFLGFYPINLGRNTEVGRLPTVWWTFVCAESGEDGLMREGRRHTTAREREVQDVREGKAESKQFGQTMPVHAELSGSRMRRSGGESVTFSYRRARKRRRCCCPQKWRSTRIQDIVMFLSYGSAASARSESTFTLFHARFRGEEVVCPHIFISNERSMLAWTRERRLSEAAGGH